MPSFSQSSTRRHRQRAEGGRGRTGLTAPVARCVRNGDGNLTPVPVAVPVSAAPVDIHVLPRRAEPDPYANPRNAVAARR